MEADLQRDRWQSAQKDKGRLKDTDPRPLEWCPQRRTPRPADEATGDTDDATAHVAGDCELVVGCYLTEQCSPADQVVGQHRAQEPGRHPSYPSCPHTGHVRPSGRITTYSCAARSRRVPR